MTAGDIRAGSVLPARREDIELHTADGLTLVGELALPAQGEPRATLICCHPLPTHGGMMDSHVLRKAAWRLPALADIAVLRFNTRGTTSARGTSEGAFDHAHGEQLDLAAAIACAQSRGLPQIWLLGWSFGTDVILRHGPAAGVTGAILLSPPLRFTQPEEMEPWAEDGSPVICLVPQYDDYLAPDEARVRFAPIPQARIVPGEGAVHLWVGEAYVRMVLDQVAGALGAPTPLPTEWTAQNAEQIGPMEKWSDL